MISITTGLKMLKTKKMKQTKELAKSGQKDDHIMEEMLERLTGKKSGDWPESIKLCMQEYAEAYHKEKMREELIHFAGYHNDLHFPNAEAKYMISIDEIKEYLKTFNTK